MAQSPLETRLSESTHPVQKRWNYGNIPPDSSRALTRRA